MEKAFRTKRLWIVIATIFISVICAVCLVACGGDGGGTSGDSDSTHTVHNYENYVCMVCGEYASDAPVTEGLSYFEIKEYDEEKDERVVVGYGVVGIGESIDKDITEIFIPQTYNDKPIIAIDTYAFSPCTNVTSIEIPNSVTAIGYDAFSGCSSLTSVNC